MSTIPRIAMTIGDPSGVGPEIAVKILSKPENRDKALVSLLASPEEVESLAAEFKVSVPLSDVAKQGYVHAIGTTYDGPAAKRGVASIAGGTRAMLDLERALELFKQDQADAILFESLN